MTRLALFAAIVAMLICGHARAGDWDDIWAPYLERTDRATSSSGNAQAINRATQIITPWPRNVHNRRIPGNGARMVGAIKAYETQQSQATQSETNSSSQQDGSSSGSSSPSSSSSSQSSQSTN